MPERTITEQFLREAPEIEAFKLGLLQSGRDLANIPLQDQIPQQQVAGLSNLEQQAGPDRTPNTRRRFRCI
jgi:hypothetical protein